MKKKRETITQYLYTKEVCVGRPRRLFESCLFKYIALVANGSLEDTLEVDRTMVVPVVIMPNSMPLLRIYERNWRGKKSTKIRFSYSLQAMKSIEVRKKDTYSSSGQLIGCANR